MEKNMELCNDLLKRMWITRGARYNAYRRLKKKNDISKATVAFLSCYALIINSIKFMNFVGLNPVQDNYISFFTMMISVFILVLSLLDSSKDYKMNADKLYISAIEIENLYNELKKIQGIGIAEREKEKKFNIISSAYSRILQLYQVNHELIDYYLMIDKKRGESFTDKVLKSLVYIRAFVLPFVFYNMLIAVTPVLFLIFLFRV